jgi:hypothetical protein
LRREPSENGGGPVAGFSGSADPGLAIHRSIQIQGKHVPLAIQDHYLVAGESDAAKPSTDEAPFEPEVSYVDIVEYVLCVRIVGKKLKASAILHAGLLSPEPGWQVWIPLR